MGNQRRRRIAGLSRAATGMLLCLIATHCTNPSEPTRAVDESSRKQSAHIVTPSQGSTEGGEEVTIIGDGLSREVEVTSDGRPANILDTSPDGSSVTVIAPRAKEPDPVDVVVRDPSSSAEFRIPLSYEYEGPLSPCEGPSSGGTTIVISDIPDGVDNTSPTMTDARRPLRSRRRSIHRAMTTVKGGPWETANSVEASPC